MSPRRPGTERPATTRPADASPTEPLPDGALLLHIGPPKTGTSTVQGAFHARRAEALAQGVRYIGRSRHSGAGVLAITGRPSFQRDAGPPPIGKWDELVRETRDATEPRLLLSSEFFADAEPAAIELIVRDLGRERLRIVLTLRPLAALLTSQWQQYVQSFMPLAYDEWLDGIFNRPRGTVTPTFWRRHRHDELIDRWAAAVGADRVTAVVIDETDHEHVLRVFERLLALTPGTLAADEDLANRSLTLPEVEAVRAFNGAFRSAGLGNALFHRVMHFGAVTYLKRRRPPTDEPRIRTPRWALQRAAAIQDEMVESIAKGGFRILGDLESLARPTTGSDATDEIPIGVPLEVASRLALGIAVVAGFARGRAAGGGELARFATYPLAGALAARIVFAVIGAIRAPFRMAAAKGDPAGGARPLDTDESRAVAVLASALEAADVRDRGHLIRGCEAWLSRSPDRHSDRTVADDAVAPDVAASLAMAMLVATGIVAETGGATRLRRVRWTWIEPPDVAVVGTARLTYEVIGRLVRVAASRAAAGMRRARSAR